MTPPPPQPPHIQTEPWRCTRCLVVYRLDRTRRRSLLCVLLPLPDPTPLPSEKKETPSDPFKSPPTSSSFSPLLASFPFPFFSSFFIIHLILLCSCTVNQIMGGTNSKIVAELRYRWPPRTHARTHHSRFRRLEEMRC